MIATMLDLINMGGIAGNGQCREFESNGSIDFARLAFRRRMDET
jgi:hypothetical protein